MSKTLEVKNPYTGELVGTLPLADKEAINSLVAKATAVKAAWADTPLFKRSEIMYRYAALILENKEDLARTLSLEMGKPIAQSRLDVFTSWAVVQGYTEKANHLYGDVFPADNWSGFERDLIFTRHEAIGLAACIIPFNFPLDLFVHKVAPAVIMGNCAIVKAPSENPLAMHKLCALFEKAGGPAGVVQCLAAERDTCRSYLLEHPDVQIISMTGSTGTGLKMAESGAKTLKRVFLELGGNDPTIVLEDADLDYAVEEVVFGRLYNSGQTCCACKRFIIHQSIIEPFTEKLIARLKKVKLGDPLNDDTELGTLISPKAAQGVMDKIGHTLKQGAKLAYGGELTGKVKAIVTPTVLTGVQKNFDVAIDLEIFGPAFPLIPFKTDEEALAIANSPQFGLQAGIITRDVVRSMGMASKIKAGCVTVNGQGNYRHVEQPFGGYKMTGIGREGVSQTLLEYSQEKSYVVRRVF
ncbi:MAG: aldehyde dehydrogenase family protein [Deltaproteobacteria bacterium]|jgi:succinate-semialdehyde dehydrogenase/glutarate-semialdehyde dehydrogenase|nr:aldehyde dehydrogenase family protein [Deltaproteobacteria bacterium]